ncbi:MAG: GNAT family N-acetyltransferase [Candidatus Melainabacteria bacterium HGW-Melainabacteria-1]|nr:MAG: GNAT family N-acetyltransferase [Candidatus Melainabacteria bacterium HGW-Melainabacteria-1]
MHQLNWPATPDGDYARRVLVPMMRDGSLAYFHNVDAEVQLLAAEGQIMPLVLGNRHPSVKNSYVASPMAHYVDYAREEMAIELGAYPALRLALTPLIGLLEQCFRALELEQVVFVNNWLLSTNLYPNFDLAALNDITQLLISQFQDRSIVFRSVNPTLNGPLYEHLLKLGYIPVFSRQVYLLDPASRSYAHKTSYLRDLSLQRRSRYVWESGQDLNMAHISRLADLYASLYLHKYSTLNPQFSLRFFETALAQNWLNFAWLRRPDASQPDAVIGWFERDGVMTAPLVGYDPSRPTADGLYRLATLKLLQEAIERNLILHQSSGVSKFKLHRGAVPAIEYNMVYDQHRPRHLRLPWQSLRGLTAGIIEPLVKRLKL